jgi:predicted nuclease of restriction endonuclease-like (RecB) superfamily
MNQQPAKTYKAFFAEVKARIEEAQLKTLMAANAQMLLLYWHMGNYILEHQQAKGWGAKIIDHLSADLKKTFPQLKGFSPRNLLYMKQFAEAYPISVLQHLIQLEKELKSMKPISQQAVAKLLTIAGDEATGPQPIDAVPDAVFLASSPGLAGRIIL